VLKDHATRVSIQLLNVNAHKITIIIQKFNGILRLMNKPGLAFVSTSRQTTFRTLGRVFLYGHVMHVSSCSLVVVSRHERIATFGDFYMEDANARLNWRFYLINPQNNTCQLGGAWLTTFT
jgi:hypothetical protein